MKKVRFYATPFGAIKVPKGVKGKVIVVSIPTPKNWKCKIKGCKIDVRHGHTTFANIKPRKKHGKN